MTTPALRLLDVARTVSTGRGDGGPRPFQLRVDRLELLAGSVLALVGPTGAGKSTLLRLLAAVDAPDPDPGSTLTWRGEPLIGAEGTALAVRRRLAMVFQDPRMLAGSVRGNVAYGLKVRGIRRGELALSVDAMLDQLGLLPLADRRASMLSGGQRQLVALARALVVWPDLLLLDEPTAHLDPSAVARAESVLLDDRRARGTTIVWATHHLFQARRVADRVALILDGRLVEVAETARFFDAPDDPRTSAFTRGEMIY